MKSNSTNIYSNREQIELYQSRVKELRETQLLIKGYKPSLNIYSDFVNDSSKITSFEPNEDDFRSFLTIYRKFISERSPIYIYKVFKICHLHLNNEKLKQSLIKVRKSWNNEFENGMLKLHLNQKEYKPREILDLWINGVYFHDDYYKIKELKSLLLDEYFSTTTKFIFHSLISSTTRQILYVDLVIKTAFENNDFNF